MTIRLVLTYNVLITMVHTALHRIDGECRENYYGPLCNVFCSEEGVSACDCEGNSVLTWTEILKMAVPQVHNRAAAKWKVSPKKH